MSRLWDQASRNVIGNQRRGAWFRSPVPWKNPRQRYAWNAFVLMDERLRQRKIPPSEFVVAAVAYYYKLPRQRRSLYRVIGPFGFEKLWPEWREKRMAEGGGPTLQGEDRVRGAASLGTRTEEAATAAGLRQFYEEYRYGGVEYAAVLSLSAPVAWALCAAEPEVRRELKRKLGDAAAWGAEWPDQVRHAAGWANELRAVAAWPEHRRAWLRALRDRAAGTAAPIVKPVVVVPGPPRLSDETQRAMGRAWYLAERERMRARVGAEIERRAAR